MTTHHEAEVARRTAERSARIKSVKKDLLTSGEFIGKISLLTVRYVHETRVGDLRIPSPHIKKNHLEAYGFLKVRKSPEDWKDFWATLTSGERSVLARTLGSAMSAGFETIGNIRKATIEELRAPHAPRAGTRRMLPRISENEATFLKQAFPQPYEGMLMKTGEWVVFR